MATNDMRVAEGIAQAVAPFDTGNLKFNAIKSELTNDGFRIRYSLGSAYYIYFLEEGTRISTRHQGFIANKTVPLIASYISAKYEQQNKKIVNEFKHYSHLAKQDTMENKMLRQKRLEQSLRIDVEQMSYERGWEHNEEMEVFDPNFRERRLR